MVIIFRFPLQFRWLSERICSGDFLLKYFLSFGGEKRMNKKLYVGNLLFAVKEEELLNLFSQAGQVVSAKVIRHRDGRSKGFGFVEMESEDSASKAVEMFNGQDFRGRKLIVAEARPPKTKKNYSQKNF